MEARVLALGVLGVVLVMGFLLVLGLRVSDRPVETFVSETTVVESSIESIESTTTEDSSTTTSTSTTSTSTTSTISVSVLINQSVNECKLVEDEEQKDWCISNVGISFNSPETCAFIVNKQTLASNYCYLNVSRVLNETYICGRISMPSYRDECYRDTGLALKEPRICFNIRHYADWNDCFRVLAVEFSNVSLCDVIRLESELQKDRDECYRDVAISLKNSTICKKVVYRPYKETCLNESL